MNLVFQVVDTENNWKDRTFSAPFDYTPSLAMTGSIAD